MERRYSMNVSQKSDWPLLGMALGCVFLIAVCSGTLSTLLSHWRGHPEVKAQPLPQYTLTPGAGTNDTARIAAAGEVYIYTAGKAPKIIEAAIGKTNDIVPAEDSGRRSPQWPKVRANHLRLEGWCAGCGTDRPDDKIEVHHEILFSEDRSRELDESNLVTLCDYCHYRIGHAGASYSIGFRPLRQTLGPISNSVGYAVYSYRQRIKAEKERGKGFDSPGDHVYFLGEGPTSYLAVKSLPTEPTNGIAYLWKAGTPIHYWTEWQRGNR